MDRQPVGSKKWPTSKWKLLRNRYDQTIHDAVFPSELGEKFMNQGIDIAIRALESTIAGFEGKS
jgi:hypothetical protein